MEFFAPAPFGGWNTRDSIDTMQPQDAVTLENLIPEYGYVKSRGGYTSFCTGLTGAVKTLVEYKRGATHKFLAAASGKIQDITSGTPASLGTGFTNDEWQANRFKADLILCNGADTPQVYDGTTLANITITAGPTPSNLKGGVTFKGRVLYWEAESQSFWYAAAGSYQGNLSEFDLGSQLVLGGNIKFITTWTRDSGEGMDDYCVFVFESGEVLIYQGSDPSSAYDWSQVARFLIGEPLSVRGYCRIGSDVAILTKDGWENLASAIQNARVRDDVSIGGKVIAASKEAISRHGSNSTFQVLFHPANSLLIVNIPVISGGSQSEQHVMNTNTGGWCKFTGWNAATFGQYNDELYFGDATGTVWKCNTGTSDNGSPIQCEMRTAWNPLGTNKKKRIDAITMLSNIDSKSNIAATGMADKETAPNEQWPDAVPAGSDSWDTATWDVAEWGADEGYATSHRFALTAEGFFISTRIRCQSAEQSMIIHRFIYEFTPGGTA